MSYKEILNKKFVNEIQSKWFKIDSLSDGARGDLFEALLGKSVDNKSLPDYYGIELKTQLENSNALITLFSKSPYNGANLRNLYGVSTIGSEGEPIKRLNATISASQFTDTGKNSYNFRIRIDKDTERIIIQIKDLASNIVSDGDYYWNFRDLQESVSTKLSVIAFIDCVSEIREGIHFVKYTNLSFVEKLSWSEFLDLIRKGKIKVDIRMGQYKTGPKKGQLHDHGTAFRISMRDLLSI